MLAGPSGGGGGGGWEHACCDLRSAQIASDTIWDKTLNNFL